MISQQGDASIERYCCRAGVSRSGYYRSLHETAPDIEEMELINRIQEIFLHNKRRYGYRRVARQLKYEGRAVNHKRVLRLMRSDNLLAIQPRMFVRTTDSMHDFDVALNLARRMTLTGINQLWVADFTYVRLAKEFVYIAVVLDAFSRKVVGWSVSRSLAASMPIEALNMALAERNPPPGLVHHSDRGFQYACGDYAGILKANQITPSMSRPANPYDNAGCESFMRTLKREEINASIYADLDDLRDHVSEFIDNYYNKYRLHSSLDYMSPADYERALDKPSADAATIPYFKPRLSNGTEGQEKKG